MIWLHDFTHFTKAKRAAIAALDVVSRVWLSTCVSAEEPSSQVEVAFADALITDGRANLLDQPLPSCAPVSGTPPRFHGTRGNLRPARHAGHPSLGGPRSLEAQA